MRTFSFNSPLVVCLIAMTLVTVVIGAQVPALAEAFLTSVPTEDPTLDKLRGYLAEHDDDLVVYQGRFDGRSFFYKPQAPRVKPEPFRRETTVKPPPKPDAPKPTRYGGPSIIYAFGDEVCFHGKLFLRVGEEASGVKVLSTDGLPWTVKLLWAGVEFDQPLFKRASGGFEAEPKKTASRIPSGGFVPSETDEPGDDADGS